MILDKLVSCASPKIKNPLISSADASNYLTKLTAALQQQNETDQLKSRISQLDAQIKEMENTNTQLQQKVNTYVPYSAKEKEYFPTELRSINLVDLKDYIIEATSSRFLEKKKETECIVFESDLHELQNKIAMLNKEIDFLKKEAIDKEKKIIDLEGVLVLL